MANRTKGEDRDTSHLDPYKWPKGVSGNPNGRPRGSKVSPEAALRMFMESGTVTVRDGNGERMEVNFTERFIRRFLTAAMAVTPHGKLRNERAAIEVFKTMVPTQVDVHVHGMSFADLVQRALADEPALAYEIEDAEVVVETTDPQPEAEHGDGPAH